MESEILNLIHSRYPGLYLFIKGAVSTIKHLQSKRRLRHILKVKRVLYLEFGAGDRKGVNGWITMDIARDSDIFWDVRRGIPFPDGSVSKIYSSHFMEHLTFKEGQRFLKECKRVLRRGGIFSVCVPNARLYLEAYVMNRSLDENRYFGLNKSAFNRTTRIDYANYTAYMDGQHKYMFDEENLLFIMNSIGFQRVRRRVFNPELDREIRDFESIYAEAEA